MKIKIKAKFIGRNSLGYVHNNVYDLDIIDSGFHMGGSQGSSITIRSSSGEGACQYSRIEMFFRNWEVSSYHKSYMVGVDSENLLLEGVLTSKMREFKLEKILK